jgi:hypothetical protein
MTKLQSPHPSSLPLWRLCCNKEQGGNHKSYLDGLKIGQGIERRVRKL